VLVAPCQVDRCVRLRLRHLAQHQASRLRLAAGDGIKLRDEPRIEIAGGDVEAEALRFDLP